MTSPGLEEALRTVEASGTRSRPTRHQARPVLILIGEALIAGRTPEAEGALARLSRLPAGIAEDFAEAVRDELSMACSEHIRSADPRYLAHPDYDLEYALSARRRLEARLRAAESLGIRPEESVMVGIGKADRLLESRARRHAANG